MDEVSARGHSMRRPSPASGSLRDGDVRKLSEIGSRSAIHVRSVPLMLVARVVFALMALIVVANTLRVAVMLNLPEAEGESALSDFSPLWAAARLALAEGFLAPFDVARLAEAQGLAPGDAQGSFFWLYPPGALMLLLPFGMLPYSAAYALWVVLGAGAFALALRALLPGDRPAFLLFLAAPAVVNALTIGNVSLLWTAGLLGALAALGAGREARGGLMVAALTLKPQLGVLIPVALAAGGRWRTFLWAAAGTLAILALSTAVAGAEYWRAFLAALGLMRELMATELVRFGRMMTAYGGLRALGLGDGAALAVQVALALAAAGVVAAAWRARGLGFDRRAAALLAAIPLATPYAYHYEMTLTLGAAVFLYRAGLAAGAGGRALLFALWLGPLPGMVLLDLLPFAFYAVPLHLLALGAALAPLRAGGVEAARG